MNYLLSVPWKEPVDILGRHDLMWRAFHIRKQERFSLFQHCRIQKSFRIGSEIYCTHFWFLLEYKVRYYFDVSLTVHLSMTLANDQLDAQIFNTFITILYMFRALSCSSSGGQIVLIQHLVLSSLSVSDRPVHRTVTY